MGLIRRRTTEGGQDRWPEVELRVYGGDDGPRGTKQILLGPDDGAPHFAVRVFQIPPGQSSNDEAHPHDHGVFVMRGRARVLLGDALHDVGPGDLVWVAPDERHRIDSLGPDTLQFLCVVPSWGEVDAASRPPAP